MTSSKEERLRKVAEIIAETAIGIPLAGLMKSKSEWVALRGEKNGAYRDVNDPFIADVTDATAEIEAVYAEEIGRLRAALEPFANVAVGRESWGDERTIEIATPPRTNVSRARLLMKEFRQAALALSTVEVEPSGAGQP